MEVYVVSLCVAHEGDTALAVFQDEDCANEWADSYLATKRAKWDKDKKFHDKWGIEFDLSMGVQKFTLDQPG